MHGILHKSLQQAVKIGYLRFNPAEACELPRVVKKEMQVLDDDHSKAFMQAIKGDPLENLFLIDLFTGLRQGELLGLTWDCIDFSSSLITVKHQLQQTQVKGDYSYHLSALKNDKPRTITPAAYVSLILPNEVVYETAMNAIVLSLFFLSTALFPAGGIDGVLGVIVNLNPFTHIINALRSLLLNGTLATGELLFVIILYTAMGSISFGWALHRLNRETAL